MTRNAFLGTIDPMRSRSLVVVLGLSLVSAVVVVACGSFSGTDGTDGTDGQTAALVDASAMDAPNNTADAPGVADSGGDAQPATRFCASQSGFYLFCADFDAPDAGDTAEFAGQTVSQGGEVRLSTMNPKSPPRALVGTAPFIPGAVSGVGQLYTTIVTNDNPHLHIELDAQIEVTFSPNAVQTVNLVELGMPDSPFLTLSYASDTGWSLELLQEYDGGMTTSVPINPAVTNGTWFHVIIDVTFAQGDAGSAMLAIDKISAKRSGFGSSPFAGTATIGNAILAVGVDAYGDRADASAPRPTVHVDNVIVTL